MNKNLREITESSTKSSVSMKNSTVLFASIFFLTLQLGFSQQHGDWNQLLKTYVKGGLVDYEKLKATGKDMQRLNAYLAKLDGWDLSKSGKDEKLAFWINAYNAFTVKLILNHFPIESIRDIKKPWKQKIWNAAGTRVSLDEIEHKILRKEFAEPRIHFAIVCASIGCPDLDNKAFEAENIGQHLDERARLFFTQSKNFKLQEKGAGVTITLSRIMDWFKNDFGDTKEKRLTFLKGYLKEKEVKMLKAAQSVDIKFLKYDWTLNKK